MPDQNITINCAVGESFSVWDKGFDEVIFPNIDLANIACGFHASDPATMARTIQRAAQHKVKIGAYPSFQDRVNFGLQSQTLPLEDITQLILYQVGALQTQCQYFGQRLHHIRPQGALFEQMMAEDDVMRAICMASASLGLPLMVAASQDNERSLAIADDYDVPLLFNIEVDKPHPATSASARKLDSHNIIAQVTHLIDFGQWYQGSNQELAIEADTLSLSVDCAQDALLIYQLRQIIDGA
ncbi:MULTISPECIES: LamB/YcsF family protein [unclassified Vibrio]|uniref:LamB/YcsF family protein n=1 Tax=Vibrio sp. HB236076 TaxID=3232307 RepID=A0AB39HKB4_9VIBR|nr:LamB/YcsF family protein [Vibrio sp. HB161653]MDP5252986.1 LamB/YcsF family protein [Vibrio sp. HB161653]